MCSSFVGFSELSQDKARSILEALRRGGVPKKYAEVLAVGREKWLKSVDDDLLFISEGGAKTRFVVAPYGGGKTHFLTLVNDKALSEKFVVSFVELQSREAPFDEFETIFNRIIRNIRTTDDFGVQHIFDKWVNSFHYYKSKDIERELGDISPSLDFRNALRSYLEISSINTPESLRRKQDIIAWIQGDPLPRSVLKNIGIRNNITIL